MTGGLKWMILTSPDAMMVTDGVDGFVSLEVSPLLANDAAATAANAARLHAMAARSNFFIKIPGTAAGLDAIERTIFAGVPVNVTLLFSTEQYLAAAEAYTRGIEMRVEAGLNADVPSVASVFVSRWDGPLAGDLPADLHLKLGIDGLTAWLVQLVTWLTPFAILGGRGVAGGSGGNLGSHPALSFPAKSPYSRTHPRLVLTQANAPR